MKNVVIILLLFFCSTFVYSQPKLELHLTKYEASFLREEFRMYDSSDSLINAGKATYIFYERRNEIFLFIVPHEGDFLFFVRFPEIKANRFTEPHQFFLERKEILQQGTVQKSTLRGDAVTKIREFDLKTIPYVRVIAENDSNERSHIFKNTIWGVDVGKDVSYFHIKDNRSLIETPPQFLKIYIELFDYLEKLEKELVENDK